MAQSIDWNDLKDVEIENLLQERIRMSNTKTPNDVAMTVLGAIATLGVVAGIGALFMVCWNAVGDNFGWPNLGYLEVISLFFVVKVLALLVLYRKRA